MLIDPTPLNQVQTDALVHALQVTIWQHLNQATPEDAHRLLEVVGQFCASTAILADDPARLAQLDLANVEALASVGFTITSSSAAQHLHEAFKRVASVVNSHPRLQGPSRGS